MSLGSLFVEALGELVKCVGRVGLVRVRGRLGRAVDGVEGRTGVAGSLSGKVLGRRDSLLARLGGERSGTADGRLNVRLGLLRYWRKGRRNRKSMSAQFESKDSKAGGDITHGWVHR